MPNRAPLPVFTLLNPNHLNLKDVMTVNPDIADSGVFPSRRDKANAIRALAMDAVQKANSGHPGMPMGMADIAEVLWCDFLNHNPSNPNWFNRDRFVLSNGHGSMLLYALLHLTGYDLPMDELREFRQMHSKTPGHPEFGITPGVESTTGPLAQGFANAVGMALAEKVLSAQFNRPGHRIVDHHTYVFLGDGCLMEGVSQEAASFAGTHRLGNLIVVYDDNNVSIDGDVAGWFTDDTPMRFRACGWHVVEAVDGHDPDAVGSAFEAAKRETAKPTIICCKTVIGWGSPNKQGNASAHGAPLGDDEVALARESIGWTHPPFEIPDSIYSAYDCLERGSKLESGWNDRFQVYADEYPDLAEEYRRRMNAELPALWEEECGSALQGFNDEPVKVATRKASQMVLDAIGPMLPEIIGGSADLTGSNLTFWKNSKAITGDNAQGNYIFFGVREFGMTCIVNGLALHGGFVPYGATFLTFSDYARNAVRMAALMRIRSILVYSHDSIGLGEDGPTHQAIEHASSLRLIPNMSLWRPCDAAETLVAWKSAIERLDGPTCLLLSRQAVQPQSRTKEQLQQIKRGGYTLSAQVNGLPDAIIIATGTEVELAVQAAQRLYNKDRLNVRVVSMPSVDTFAAQSLDYQESVLPSEISSRVAVEAGSRELWFNFTGPKGVVVGVPRFGESAPAQQVYEHFDVTVDALEKAVVKVLNS